ncbi:MAG: M56 family metallopeptidase [bacterium]
MLIEWMAYATLFGALACGAALAAEQLAAIWGVGRRFAWLAALVVAAAAPVVLSALRAPPAPSRVSAATGASATNTRTLDLSRIMAPSRARHPTLASRAAGTLARIDPYLRDAWLAASLVLLTLFLRAMIGLRRQRVRWREIDLAGTRLLLAPDAGPAVVGVLRPRVVVPEWALSLDATARELMLRHEDEHIRARDPQLLLIVALCLVLLPWNAALWFIGRRLRLAIEVDCDRRVLRGSAHPHDYGMLLLTVGARHSASLPLAASLAERRPLLERRIRAMTTPRPRSPKLASFALVAIAIVATTAAVRTPRPAPLTTQHPTQPPTQATPPMAPAGNHAAAMVDTAITRAATTPSVRRVDSARPASVGAPVASSPATATQRKSEPLLTVRQIVEILAAHHPTVIAGDSSINLITIVLDAQGHYVYSTAGKVPDAQFSETALTEDALGAASGSAEGRARGGRGGAVAAAGVGRGRNPDSAAERAVVEVEAANARSASTQRVAFAPNGQNTAAAGSMSGSATVSVLTEEHSSQSSRVNLKVFRGDSLQFDPSSPLASLIDPAAIGAVELRTYRAGLLVPGPLGLVIIQLKARDGK